MYNLNNDALNALHEYRRAELVRLVGDARVNRRSRSRLRWPPWLSLRPIRRRQRVAGRVAHHSV